MTEIFRSSEFKVFSGAPVIRAMKATGEFPRSRFDALTEKAQSLGAKGLAWAVVEGDGGWRSPIAKFLSEDEIARANDALGAKEGDAILIVADTPAVAARVLGALRPEVGQEPEGHDIFWVVDFPAFEWDEDGAAVGRGAPPVHQPGGRSRRGPRHLARARLRRGLRRLGARRRVDP